MILIIRDSTGFGAQTVFWNKERGECMLWTYETGHEAAYPCSCQRVWFLVWCLFLWGMTDAEMRWKTSAPEADGLRGWYSQHNMTKCIQQHHAIPDRRQENCQFWIFKDQNRCPDRNNCSGSKTGLERGEALFGLAFILLSMFLIYTPTPIQQCEWNIEIRRISNENSLEKALCNDGVLLINALARICTEWSGSSVSSRS